MLNISENQVKVDTSKYRAFEKTNLVRAHTMFRRWILAIFCVNVVLLFLPWTQNIRAKGVVTTLSPDQRPQTIHTVIAGQIEKWYVREGQLVKKGDTIVKITEIKTDYFDPELLPRTQAQVYAKANSVLSYSAKSDALKRQIVQTQQELKFKQDQLRNKIEQTKLKIEANRNKMIAAEKDFENEKIQANRTEELYKQGLKSLTDLENKRLKVQQTQAKQVEAQNDYAQSVQELDNLQFQLRGAESEYQGKIAKTESERFSTISDGLEAEANVNKLKSQYANYSARAKFYYIIAPQDCYITQATRVGIGETVKEGEAIVSIVPEKMNLAVEVFIEPIDLPLVQLNKQVRFIFDGWPAFIFSGWPNASIGTYSGRIVAIDNVANAKGKFRLLVAPDKDAPAWPNALRPGGGAQSFTLLKDVPVWYELWRQLNGFPPEYYQEFSKEPAKKEKEK
ncbi:MAG: HlyD family efflux transporter periplasmic adaptor subunit [Saprospiraceae bacterium]|nr:HlyD family efflux transporter periplasmic adaptor subunit [Saprospiraceae bacterium]